MTNLRGSAHKYWTQLRSISYGNASRQSDIERAQASALNMACMRISGRGIQLRDL